jgi:AcrR family transcriptional regulator
VHQIGRVNHFLRNGIKLSEPRRRGRPPAYDRDEALAALTRTFWDQGYAATSLDDLAAATAMNRPSLYAAFGGKQAMYLAALDGYRRGAEAQLSAVLDSEADVRAAIAALFGAGRAFYGSGEAGPQGCLAVCTATAEAVGAPEIRGGLEAVLAMMDDVIARRLARAVAEGQLPPDFDVAARARLIGAMMHSLAVRSRAGESPAALAGFARDAAALALV